MKVTHTENTDGSLDISIKLTTEDIMCLSNNLPGVDGIVDWCGGGPLWEKIKNCADRMDKDGRSILETDPAVTSIPGNLKDRLALIAAHPNYKNRAADDPDSVRTVKENILWRNEQIKNGIGWALHDRGRVSGKRKAQIIKEAETTGILPPRK